MAGHDWLDSGVHDLTTKTAIADRSTFIMKMHFNVNNKVTKRGKHRYRKKLISFHFNNSFYMLQS